MLPDGFTERVARLRNPDRLMADMVHNLEQQEKADGLVARRQEFWESLDPDLREQFQLWLFGPTDPRLTALKERLDNRRRRLDSGDPDEVALQAEFQWQLEQGRMEGERSWQRRLEVLKEDLEEAGLPYRPELLDLYPWYRELRADRSP